MLKGWAAVGLIFSSLHLGAANANPAPSPLPSPALPPPSVWQLTGTSSATLEAEPLVRVQRRTFEKDERLFARAGFSYLSRGDLRTNPGVSLDLGWYPLELLGIEILSSTIFFSQLDATADALRRSTGLLPDSEKPIARLTAGARLSLAYGKLLVEPISTVLHFDASLSLHLGGLITDETFNPGGDFGLAFSVGIAGARGQPQLFLFLAAEWLGALEDRERSSFASGVMGTLGFGVLL